MPLRIINTGSSANSGDGDNLRLAVDKTNSNFLYVSNSIIQLGFPHTPSKGLARITGSFIITGSVTSSENIIVDTLNANNLFADNFVSVTTTASLAQLAVNYASASHPDNSASYISFEGTEDDPDMIRFVVDGDNLLQLTSNTMSFNPNNKRERLLTIGSVSGITTNPFWKNFFQGSLTVLSDEGSETADYGIRVARRRYPLLTGYSYNTGITLTAPSYTYHDSIKASYIIAPKFADNPPASNRKLGHKSLSSLGGTGDTRICVTYSNSSADEY